MEEQFEAKYTELIIRPNITEAIAVADVSLDPQQGVIEIKGLHPGLSLENITVSCEDAKTSVASVVDPSDVGRVLAANPDVTIVDVNANPHSGRLLYDKVGRGELALVDEEGKVTLFPNPRAISHIELVEKLRADPLLRVAYIIEQEKQETKINIGHLLDGLSFCGIIYELDFSDTELLCLNPFVYVSNKTSRDFTNVKLTLVMPEKPEPEGDKIRTEISPLEQTLGRGEDVIVRQPRRPEPFAVRRLGPAGGAVDTCLYEKAVSTQETIEGTVAVVDTKGRYSLGRGENKRAGLKEMIVGGYQRSNVLLINTAKYDGGKIYYTSIIDGVRLMPGTDLKAGSFYFDGQKLQFPPMKKGQEYELGLRTCRNLEAQISVQEAKTRGEREEEVTTATYAVRIVNNTGEEQKVDVNIPLHPIRKGADFILSGNIEYVQKKITGEQCYVANIPVPAQGSFEFSFKLQGR